MRATAQVNEGATSVHCCRVGLHLLIEDAHLCEEKKGDVRGEGCCCDIFDGVCERDDV